MTELQTVHRFTTLGVEADALGLTLRANRLQFTLRDVSTNQLYASGRTLDEVDEWLRRKRHERRHVTEGLQRALTAWPPRDAGC